MESTEHGRVSVREFHANGSRMVASEVEAKLDQGNIQEAEDSLKEALSLNFEVCLLILPHLTSLCQPFICVAKYSLFPPLFPFYDLWWQLLLDCAFHIFK